MRPRTTRSVLSGLLLLGVLAAACSSTQGSDAGSATPASRPAGRPVQTPGPLRPGFEGLAYPVPTGADPDHVDAVRVTRRDASGQDVGVEDLPAGKAVEVKPVAGHPDQVAVPRGQGITAVGARSQFWAMPGFIGLRDMTVPIDGREVPLGLSGIRYHRGSVATFSDSSHRFDGLIPVNREFLQCRSKVWGMGGQTFAVDLIEDGVHRDDRGLLDLGVRAVDWGVGVPIGPDGIHQLHRDCDGKTVADFGYTHHTTQWLESLSRATYLLAASPWAGDYHDAIARYRHRVEEIATVLTKRAVRGYWVRHVKDAYGNDFTHRTFMRAAAMGMASTLAEKPRDSIRWAADARQIAMRGVHNQLPSGIFPERGGFDVQYQMYGGWLAELYEGTLPPTSPMKAIVDRAIRRGIDWMTTRIRPNTGQIRIRGTTRVCVEQLWTRGQPAPFVDPGEAIRAFLLWGHLSSEPRLVELAILMDHGHRAYGNTCPPDYHAKPEQPAKDE